MFFIRWIISFFYRYDVPLPDRDRGVHGSDRCSSVKVTTEEILDIETIKFKSAFEKIQRYNILDETDYEYINKCRNEKMMEYIRNIE